MFLIYVNDLFQSVSDAECFICADYMTILVGSNCYNNVTSLIQKPMQEVNLWFISNKLHFNNGKTNTLLLTLKNHNFINLQSVRFLGIQMGD